MLRRESLICITKAQASRFIEGKPTFSEGRDPSVGRRAIVEGCRKRGVKAETRRTCDANRARQRKSSKERRKANGADGSHARAVRCSPR